MVRAVILAFLSVFAAPDVRAEGLVTSLSEHLVSITSSFTGDDILVFGAVGEFDDPTVSPFETFDIAVVVRGPPDTVVARRKEHVAGIWANRRSVTFRGVPGYYAVASTGALREIATEEVLARHQIGTEFLRFGLAKPAQADDPVEVGAYQRAVIRNRSRAQLYRQEPGAVTFLGERLFRWTVRLPATVPEGNYKVEVYLLRSGQIVSAQFSPLFVYKTGIERRLFRLAHDWSLLYGLTAVLVALGAGWLANRVFGQD